MAELVIVIIENSSPRRDFRFKKVKYEILSSVVGFSILGSLRKHDVEGNENVI